MRKMNYFNGKLPVARENGRGKNFLMHLMVLKLKLVGCEGYDCIWEDAKLNGSDEP